MIYLKENGFEIVNLVVQSSDMIKFPKKRNLISHLKVNYYGTLIIKDTQLFMSCVRKGIGAGKYAGMGLLCVW